jgi:hypothetical protein
MSGVSQDARCGSFAQQALCLHVRATSRHPATDGVFLLCCVPKDQGGFLVREAPYALRHLRANIDDNLRRRIRGKLPIVNAPLMDCAYRRYFGIPDCFGPQPGIE